MAMGDGAPIRRAAARRWRTWRLGVRSAGWLVVRMEDLKRDPAEFGGVQDIVMRPEAIRQRYCAARGCGGAGYVQLGEIRHPRSGVVLYRIFCRWHMVLLVLLQDVMLGDPSPTSEARNLALAVGVQPQLLAMIGADPSAVSGIGLFNPKYARCVHCGGGFVGEIAGMFSGTRYVHTCGVTNAQARQERG